jgi:putative nucleotidyltransferase with HDIG domain
MDKGTENKVDSTSAQTFAGSEIDLIPAMDSSIEPFLLFDEKLNCVSMNLAAEKLFGVSEEDMVGKNILEVVPNTNDTEACVNYQNVMKGAGNASSHSQFGDLRLSLQAFKLGNGLGIILKEITECSQDENGGKGRFEIEQRLDLSGRLAALSELAESVASELNALAGEQGILEKLKVNDRSGPRSVFSDAKVTFHSRELSSYLEEFNKVMCQLLGGRERAELEDSYLRMARTLAIMAETREPYANGHSERVSLLANEIAVWLGCPAELMKGIHLAAILHDVGKIIIPDSILFKPGELTPAEYSEVKRHPGAAVAIIRNLSHFEDVIPIIESHHEWYNGTGYPNSLGGDGINIGARVLAVADAFDAMTSPRPYRPRLSDEDAVRIIRNGAGTQWDPMITHAFLEILGVASDGLQTIAEEERPVAAEQKEMMSRADEALKRAEHWAHWMEAVDESKQKRSKAK